VSHKRSPGDHLRDAPPVEAVIAALAARQRGLVKIAQLVAAGVTPNNDPEVGIEVLRGGPHEVIETLRTYAVQAAWSP
jgi:hypothetical protein